MPKNAINLVNDILTDNPRCLPEQQNQQQENPQPGRDREQEEEQEDYRECMKKFILEIFGVKDEENNKLGKRLVGSPGQDNLQANRILVPDGNLEARLVGAGDIGFFNLKEWCISLAEYVFENDNDKKRQATQKCGQMIKTDNTTVVNIRNLKQVYNDRGNVKGFSQIVGNNKRQRIRLNEVRPFLDHCYDEQKLGNLYEGLRSLLRNNNLLDNNNVKKVIDMTFIVFARAAISRNLSERVGVEDWHYYWLRDAIREASNGNDTIPLCLTRGDVAVFLYLLLGLARDIRST